jgi:2-polyprenyl-6-methoxyphenol hydroxylase-like FAD-dependent oxidoreductase
METCVTSSDAVSVEETEVVIVGGGPVGLGLAIELGQRGVRCVIVERWDEPQPIPKGQNLTQRTMEHFFFWGAEAALRAARTIPRSFGIGGLTAYRTLLGPYSYDWLQRDVVKPFYFTDNERLPQYATEAVLRARAAQLPAVAPWYGCEARSIEQGPDGVTLTVTPRGGGKPRTIQALYVVGCDGSRSDVREQAGISQTLNDHDRHMVLLVFESRELHELLARYPGKSYFNILQPELDGYWKFFGRVDLGLTWFFHAPVPPDTTAENFDFPRLLREAIGADFDINITYTGFWDLRFAIADAYRAGRVFVAGDAAHSHPPYGGYGVNSGLEDARNLGWKLAAVLQGWGGERLLDSYDLERRPVFESTSRDFIAKSIENDREFLRAFDPTVELDAFETAWHARAQGAVGEVNSFEPHYEGSPMVCPAGATHGACSSAGSHRFEARAGHHLAPATLANGHNVYEALGPGWALLAVDADPRAVEAFEQAAAERRMPLSVICDPGGGEIDRYAARLVLVRPDQFVAWASPSPTLAVDEIRHLLLRSSGETDPVIARSRPAD